MDTEKLKNFDLYFPYLRRIKGEDRDWAFQVKLMLGFIQSEFVEAVAAYSLFKPITAENVFEYMERRKSPYEGCLNKLYAKAFVYALHNIEKLIYQLTIDKKNPTSIQTLYSEYKNHFGDLRHIRDSAMHIEDRGRGVNRHQKPIDTNILIIQGFLENRFTFTGADGNQYEIEISEHTLIIAKEIIQKIINSYTWTLL